jgi:hypothetical protein
LTADDDVRVLSAPDVGAEDKAPRRMYLMNKMDLLKVRDHAVEGNFTQRCAITTSTSKRSMKLSDRNWTVVTGKE